MAKLAIVRVKGLFGVRPQMRTTLESLRLFKVNHCTVVEDSPSLRGMLQVAKDYVCWGEVKEETLKAVLAKRENLLEKKKNAKNAPKADAQKATTGAKDAAKPSPQPVKKEKKGMLFALHAPRGGWNETIKKRFPHGAAGPRTDMDSLLVSMS